MEIIKYSSYNKWVFSVFLAFYDDYTQLCHILYYTFN